MANNGKIQIESTVLMCDTPDSRGLVYPKDVMERAVEKYREEMRNNNVCELNHFSKNEYDKLRAEVKESEEIINDSKKALEEEIKNVWADEMDEYFGLDDDLKNDPEYAEYLRLKKKFGKK